MLKKLISFIETLIILFALVFCIFTILQRTVFKKDGVFGYKTFVIVTNSMSPEYERNDVILVKKEKVENIKKGDNITYMGAEGTFKGKVVTHKVIDIIKEDHHRVFYTKGNKNLAIDPPIYYEQISGVVKYKFFFISLISRIIRTRIGFWIFGFIPLLILFTVEVIKIKKEIDREY